MLSYRLGTINDFHSKLTIALLITGSVVQTSVLRTCIGYKRVTVKHIGYN